MIQNKIIGKIESAKLVKAGQTNGKNWTKYEVIINGDKFSAFDEQFLALIGKEGEFGFKTEDRTTNLGVQYQSKTLFNLGKPAQPKPQTPIYPQLDRIEKKLDMLLNKFNTPNEPEIGGHV